MKKIFWYVLVPAGVIAALFWGIPRAVDRARDRENERMQQDREYANERAQEITRPAADTAGGEPSLQDSIDAYTPPKVDVRDRAEEIMQNRGEELEQADEW